MSRIAQLTPIVIDLAVPHPEGGMNPEAGLVLTEMPVRGRFLIGHTASLADPDAPVIVRQADITSRPDSGLSAAKGRCPRCIAKTAIWRSDAETVLVLEHQAGCRAFRKLLRRAGQ
jgi:hypothetical protein